MTVRPRLSWTVALALALALGAGCARRPAFRGTALDPPRDALDFTLTDQFGGSVRLADLRGRAVVLTFLYTSCTDVCPLVTQKIHDVTELLGARRREVAFLAVTVDPARDTVAQGAAYSRRWGLLDRWRFLTGSEAVLAPLWRYYWVGDVRRAAVGSPAASAAAAPAAYDVEHAAPVHLVDRRGRIRVVYGSEFRPAELAHDIDILLRE
jgi:protein SCO1/2